MEVDVNFQSGLGIHFIHSVGSNCLKKKPLPRQQLTLLYCFMVCVSIIFQGNSDNIYERNGTLCSALLGMVDATFNCSLCFLIF